MDVFSKGVLHRDNFGDLVSRLLPDYQGTNRFAAPCAVAQEVDASTLLNTDIEESCKKSSIPETSEITYHQPSPQKRIEQ